MKKRVLSILLCLCMVLMLCPVAAFADENYMITQNFKYGTRTYPGDDPHTSPYTFVIPAGGSFGLATIEDCSPYELVGWKETGSGTVYPPYGEIENLSSDLTFDAVYQVQGGLTITVDGFMPGNTPNACTYTLESTIPGVTISSDDIEGGAWAKYVFDGTKYDWYTVENDQEFEAGTAYQCVISMKNYSLDLAPAVTVNGRTPETCRVAYYNGVPYALEITCELGTPVAPTLAVTVDNFEVGKTPNDITYSFASTNLDVTFSEEDILANTGSWKYYCEEDEAWLPMSNTEVFEAGTRYWCTINLDNKGLTVAPAATMNGKTPESCSISTKNGVPYALAITCDLGTPLAQQLTISGPDWVCKEQDYEFSVTAAEGAEALYFVYRFGEYGSEMPWSRTEDGVYYGTVPASEYGDADSMVLTVNGTSASGKPATATKTVQISQEHIFVDGVCACGAARQYEIAYMSAGTSEDGIPSGVKTHGVDFTLSSETFTRDGYVQTGWHDEYGTEYELGGDYTLDEDMTFYPIFEKLVTLTADFTTTVALGDAGEPGETTFELGLIDSEGNELTFDDQFIGAEITTDGAGSYSGTMTITATEDWLFQMLYEGAFIWQYDGEEEGWTYDDTVWGVRLYMPEVAARSVSEVSYELLLYPTYLMGDGSFNLDLNAGPVDEMTFTNTYTAHAYEQNHDATHHWDECECKDVQNKELHKYGDWKVTKEATQTAKGEKEHTCTVCGYAEKVEIPKRTTVDTGDNSSFALWVALFTLSAAAVITTATMSKKKKLNR